MLRNAYLEPYKKVKKKMSEYEKEMLNHDGEHILKLDRPLSNQGIRRVPNNMLPNFVNDVMCNKEIGHLLYPLSFKKEVALYLKLQNYVYKITSLNKNKDFLENLKENYNNNIDKNNEDGFITSPIIINYEKQEEVENIKNKINSFKTCKNKEMKKLKIKNKNFFKSQPLIDKKLTKLSFRPINDIRIRGYQKAFLNCLDRTFENKDFNLPDIQLDSKNVFSRLYNNVILKNLPKNKYINKSNDERFENFSNFRKNKDLEFLSDNLQLKEMKSSSTINMNSKIISPMNAPTPKKKEQKFNVANIFKSYNGREFTKKITPKMYEKCLSSLSGGPNSILKKCMSAKNIRNSKNSKKKKKYINYSAKLTKKNCFLKPNLKQHNVNNKNEDYISEDTINSLIMANSNSRSELINIKRFRDVDYNTNLHMAVLKNSYKFVDYFIKKKLDVNKKNKEGNTPLHLAIKIGNYDIIKLLLDNGANILIKNKKGLSPYDLANSPMKNKFNLEEMYNRLINKY